MGGGGEWMGGLQSRDGGWAAFDADNLEYYLNNIPFSDHGALLDPPTEDVTARCVAMLAQLGETAATRPRRARRWRAALNPSAEPNCRMGHGSGGGASTTSTARGQCYARSMPR